jgi:hypothetical protein
MNLNRSSWMLYAKRVLRRMRQAEKDPQKKQDFSDVLRAIDKGIYSYEEWLQEAKMLAIRNPAFDGDMVGWLDDDLDDDEDDEQKKK